MIEPVHVAVGVITGADGRILVARRPANVHQGDLWEFPGGKRERDETILQALIRELREELDIEIDPAGCFPLRKISHVYDERSVILDVWRVRSFSGTPHGREAQPIAWKHPREMIASEFPAANRRIIELLRLPGMLAITAPADDSKVLLESTVAILESGVKFVQLRQPGVSTHTLLSWAALLMPLCASFSARLSINVPATEFDLCRAHGLHVSSNVLSNLDRRPVAADVLFGASCHSLAELRKAEAVDVDYALLSPVKQTGSHPGAQPLGWETFANLVRQVSLPVYALGGLGPVDMPMAERSGGHGIAAIGAFHGARGHQPPGI